MVRWEGMVRRPGRGVVRRSRSCHTGRVGRIRYAACSRPPSNPDKSVAEGDPNIVEVWYRSARRRWNAVAWSLQRFERHVGGEHPAHPEDLFLGGAAGERMDAAWEVISAEIGPLVMRRIACSPGGGMSSEDVWSETVLKLMSPHETFDAIPDGRVPARIIGFRGRSTLTTYFVVAANRLAIDAHRRRSRRPSTRGLDGPEADQATAESASPRSEASIDDDARMFADVIRSLPAERRALLMLVHGRGVPKARAGAMLGMPPYKVTRELRAAFEEIRDRSEFVMKDELDREMVLAWLRAWTMASRIKAETDPGDQEIRHAG